MLYGPLLTAGEAFLQVKHAGSAQGEHNMSKHAPCVNPIHAMRALLLTGYAETSLVCMWGPHAGHATPCRPSLKVTKVLKGFNNWLLATVFEKRISEFICSWGRGQV
eukprot:1156521-Pelagomonas_calceolata.AAC.12